MPFSFISLSVKNLAEAEYSVALYMYMRLLGYPADRISILTTYNGQKHLIRDVLNQRCAGNPFFGHPNKVRTLNLQMPVDKQHFNAKSSDTGELY